MRCTMIYINIYTKLDQISLSLLWGNYFKIAALAQNTSRECAAKS